MLTSFVSGLTNQATKLLTNALTLCSSSSSLEGTRTLCACPTAVVAPQSGQSGPRAFLVPFSESIVYASAVVGQPAAWTAPLPLSIILSLSPVSRPAQQTRPDPFSLPAMSLSLVANGI